jgi:hypothetical protein
MRLVGVGMLSALVLSACSNGSIVETFKRSEYESSGRAALSYSLPRAYLPVTLELDDQCNLTVEFHDARLLPDPTAEYVLDYHPNANTSDALTVAIDGGLLQSVNATSEPQTKEIVGKLIEVAKTAVVGPDIKAAGSVTCPRLSLARHIDLANPSASQKALKSDLDAALKNTGISIKPVLGPKPQQRLEGDHPESRRGTCLGESMPGVCYRPARLYALEATFQLKESSDKKQSKAIAGKKDGQQGQPTEQGQQGDVGNNDGARPDSPKESAAASGISAKLAGFGTMKLSVLATGPDVNSAYYIPFNRKVFTRFDVKLTFKDGMLTKFESTDASETVAALALPADVFKNVAGIYQSPGAAAPKK